MQRQLKYYYPTILETCKTLTVNHQDLAHDVYLKLHIDNKFMQVDNKEGYIYTVARNLYRDQIRKDRTCELLTEPTDEEQQETIDPYYIYEKIGDFRLEQEIMGIVLELYYHFEGNVASIEREMKSKGMRLTRQTLSRYIDRASKEFRKWL